MNKTQRASLTVRCPECSAKVGQRCSVLAAGMFSHIVRYQKANRTSGTGRRGDPMFAR